MAKGSNRPQKTAMIIAQRIVSTIAAQNLGPGAILPSERIMLEEYGVGRATLREALRFLEFQGVVAMKPGPGGGPVVQQPDASTLSISLALLLQFSSAPYRAIAEARSALEPMIAYLAAQRIDDDTILQLDQSVSAMGANMSDRSAFLAENQRFHDLIAWSSGNALFGYLLDSILGILDGTVLGIDYPPHRRLAILAAHETVLKAIQARDPVAAQEAMAAHIEAYMTYAERRYPDVLDQVITLDQLPPPSYVRRPG